MKKKSLLVFLLAALSSLTVSAATAGCGGESETPPTHTEHVFDGWSLTVTPTATGTGTASRT